MANTGKAVSTHYPVNIKNVWRILNVCEFYF